MSKDNIYRPYPKAPAWLGGGGKGAIARLGIFNCMYFNVNNTITIIRLQVILMSCLKWDFILLTHLPVPAGHKLKN